MSETATFTERIDGLCYDHIERDEPISTEDLAWLIDTAVKLHERLSDASVLVAALSVYGEDASLPALVRSARSQADLIQDALVWSSTADPVNRAGRRLSEYLVPADEHTDNA